jgi:hypothetical protein
VAPQDGQNFTPSGISAPQEEHLMAFPPSLASVGPPEFDGCALGLEQVYVSIALASRPKDTKLARF